jgi:hypothetical protein
MLISPWPHQRHVPAQHVEELGQLVEAALAEQFAAGDDARIAAQLVIERPFGAGLRIAGKQLREPRLGVDHHRAELEAGEIAAVAADAALDEEDRAGIARLDGERDREQQRQQEGEGGKADQDVQPPDRNLLGPANAGTRFPRAGYDGKGSPIR